MFSNKTFGSPLTLTLFELPVFNLPKERQLFVKQHQRPA